MNQVVITDDRERDQYSFRTPTGGVFFGVDLESVIEATRKLYGNDVWIQISEV